MRRFYKFPEIKNVCIIGGGVAGLQAARAMQRIGVNRIEIIERNSQFGGVWVSNKYENLGLQHRFRFYQFAEYLYREHSNTRNIDEFPDDRLNEIPSAGFLRDYISGYAAKFNLERCTAFNTEVQQLSKLKEPVSGQHVGWNVAMKSADGSSFSKRFDFVIMANGVFNQKNSVFPSIENLHSFEEDGGIAVHSSDWHSGLFEGKRNLKCMVIGAGKSSYDIASNCIDSPTFKFPVIQCKRRAKWHVPLKIANILPFEYLIYNKFADLSFVPRYPDSSQTEVDGAVNNRIVLFLKKYFYWNLLQRVFAVQFGWQKEDVPTLDIHPAGQLLPTDESLRKLMKNGSLQTVYGEVAKYDAQRKRFVLKDSRIIEEEVNVLCSATGFQTEYSLFAEKDIARLGVESDGLYLYNNMLPTQLDRIAFVGSQLVSYQNIVSHFLQSEWLGHHLKYGVEIDTKKMLDAVSQDKEFKRKYYPPGPRRSAIIQLHWLGYHNLLCQQMNTTKHLKSNCIKRLMCPYSAEDYARILQDECRRDV